MFVIPQTFNKRNQHCPIQGFHSDGRTNTSVRPFVMSDKALVRPLRKYSSIFEHILENIQRICQLRPIANGQNRLSVRPSRSYMTGLLPHPSSMTTLVPFFMSPCMVGSPIIEHLRCREKPTVKKN
jgi:hypothetical protein